MRLRSEYFPVSLLRNNWSRSLEVASLTSGLHYSDLTNFKEQLGAGAVKPSL